MRSYKERDFKIGCETVNGKLNYKAEPSKALMMVVGFFIEKKKLYYDDDV